MSGWVGQYVGLPYLDHGRDRRGVDCWGLVRLILAEQFGVTALPAPDYRDAADGASAAAAVAGELGGGRWRRVAVPQAGDVALFNVNGRPAHVGLCLDRDRMVHVVAGRRCSCVERLDSPLWAPRLEGVYRYEP